MQTPGKVIGELRRRSLLLRQFRPLLQHLRPLPDSQPDPRPMLVITSPRGRRAGPPLSLMRKSSDRGCRNLCQHPLSPRPSRSTAATLICSLSPTIVRTRASCRSISRATSSRAPLGSPPPGTSPASPTCRCSGRQGSPGGYALVVNGTATGRREPGGVTRAEITLTKSVLHRAGPKPPDSDGPCTSDCRRIARPT